MNNVHIKSAVVGFVLLFSLSPSLCPATLQGKLIKFGPLGVLPAPFVTVTLSANNNRKLIRTEHSDARGIYFFNGCPAGTYILKIWVRGAGERPLDFKINVSSQPVTNIAPILIHSLLLNYPEEGQPVSANMDISMKGTYYNIPDDAFIWIVLKRRDENFYLATDEPVKLNPGQTWESFPMKMEEGTVEVLAVLVTRKGNHDFRMKSKSDMWSSFSQLPGNSYTLARRKIKLLALPSPANAGHNH
jgi:hypothetical protein